MTFENKRISEHHGIFSNLPLPHSWKFWDVAHKTSNYAFGGIFRDFILMPFHEHKQHLEITHQSCVDLFNDKIDIDNDMRKEILSAFEVDTKEFCLSMNDITYWLKVRIFESKNKHQIHTCVRVGGNDETLDAGNVRVYPLLKSYVKTAKEQSHISGLRIIQFSLYGHEIQTGTSSSRQTWKPSEAAEIGKVFFEFLRVIHSSQGIQTNSLICHSLGSIVFEALDANNSLLPEILILDRAFTSLWKVGCKLYHPFVAYLLCSGAYLAKWSTNPEKRLIDFFKQCKSNSTSLEKRKIVMLEVKNDWYFSEQGAFDNHFMEDLRDLGISQSYRKKFEPSEIAYHPRAHHALSLDKMKNNREEETDSLLSLKVYESAASGLIKFLLLSQKS